MKTPGKAALATAIIAAAGLFFAWPYIKMDFAESASYTEQDKREYEFFTPALLKKMPRISDRYEFGYSNVSGPALHIYDLKFYGTTETRSITNWLEENGFRRAPACNIQGTCWKGSDPKISVSVGVVAKPKTVIVSVLEEP